MPNGTAAQLANLPVHELRHYDVWELVSIQGCPAWSHLGTRRSATPEGAIRYMVGSCNPRPCDLAPGTFTVPGRAGALYLCSVRDRGMILRCLAQGEPTD